MKQNKNTIALALMAIAFTQLSSSAVTPALANICSAFPLVPAIFVSMLSTLPSLLSAPFTLISGFLAGHKVHFRTLEILGILLMLISGVAPFFSNSFYVILFWRSLFGIGTGLAIPLLMPLTMTLFKQNSQGQMGNNSIATNVGAIIFQFVGGLLCTQYGWRSTFLIYVLLMPILLIIGAFLPEPTTIIANASNVESMESKNKIGSCFPWCVLNLCYMIFFYALVTQTSKVIQESSFGGAATSGTVLAIFTVGGVLGGLIFRRSKRILNNVFMIVYICMILGFFIMSTSSNIILFAIGELVCGIGFGLFSPAIAITVGLLVPSTIRTKASSLLAIFGNMGGFLSAFLLVGLGNLLGVTSGRFSFWASFVFFIIMAITSPFLKMNGLPHNKTA